MENINKQMNNKIDSLKEKVLKKIKEGEVSMKPRSFFVWKMVAITAVSIFILFVAVLILSFIFFSIRESGEHLLLGFGRHGFFTFITIFPWLLLIVSVGLLFLLDYILRYFKFGYRLPLLEIFIIVLLVSGIAGFTLNLTPLHPSLLQSADRNELPLFGPMYRSIHTPHKELGIYRGVVVSTTSNTISISHDNRDMDTDDGDWVINVPAGFDMSQIYLGERIFAACRLQNGIIQAYGIRYF